MAKVISQETFDDVVKENIVEFSMTPNEAKKESVSQFEAQGINLANIIQDLTIKDETGRPVLNETIERLKEISFETHLDHDEVPKLLDTLTNESASSVPHRVMAVKLGALDLILEILEIALRTKEDINSLIIKKSFQTWNELTNKQPDIFDDKSLFIVISLLKKNPDKELTCLVLRLLKHATLLHEFNRQNIMNTEIMKCLQPLLQKNDAELLKETCSVFRHLILDDDIRVEFSKAHEHARAIATDVLVELTELLPVYSKDKSTLCELFLTIGALTVRHEFCLDVEKAGGLTFILNAMREHADSMRLAREAFKLIKALAGNDAVKANTLKDGAAELIVSVLNTHKDTEGFARAALGCISILALRSKENSELLFEANIVEALMETMKLHSKSKIVQRNGAWAIRNMVARSRDQCPTFLANDAEQILNEAMTNYPDVAYDIKSALRDLGCDVKLNEAWTGTKNKITMTN